MNFINVWKGSILEVITWLTIVLNVLIVCSGLIYIQL